MGLAYSGLQHLSFVGQKRRVQCKECLAREYPTLPSKLLGRAKMDLILAVVFDFKSKRKMSQS